MHRPKIARHKKREYVLSGRLDKQLKAYALAAGAASVSLLAATPPADAQIVYTPAHIVVPVNGSVLLDLNHDGLADFRLINRLTKYFSSFAMSVTAVQGHNGVMGYVADTVGIASRLMPLQSIGSRGLFGKMGLMGKGYSFFSTRFLGPWTSRGKGFLGLKFEINGHIHYGWASIEYNSAGRVYQETVTGYAYNTEPGVGLLAGQRHGAKAAAGAPSEPASLGVLALGSLGLGFWRPAAARPERTHRFADARL